MNSIRINIDEDLLTALDATEEVKKEGRSAVIRKAAALYLRKVRDREIADGYRKAYASGNSPFEGFDTWVEQHVWPEE